MKKRQLLVLGAALSAALIACSAAESNLETREDASSVQTTSLAKSSGRVMEGTTSVQEESEEAQGESETSWIKEEYVASEGESLAAQIDHYFNPFVYQQARNDWGEEFARRNNYALAEGYQFLGQAYFNDFMGEVRTAYIPHGGIINLIEGMVSGSNHGIYIANGVIPGLEAAEIAKELKEAVDESGFSIRIGEITEKDGKQRAYFPFYYEEKYNGVNYKHFGIRYASSLSGEDFLFSEIIFTPQQFDGDSEKIMKELENVFMLDFLEADNFEENAWFAMTGQK